MARITKKKAVCFFCEAKFEAGAAFCSCCERPTGWATHDQRIEWEVRQWRSARPASPARAARGRSTTGPAVHAPPPPRPRKPRPAPAATETVAVRDVAVPDDALQAPVTEPASKRVTLPPTDGNGNGSVSREAPNGKILAEWELEAIERRRVAQPVEAPAATGDVDGSAEEPARAAAVTDEAAKAGATKKSAKKRAAKKASARKPAAKKASARKPAAKKASAKKPAAKRASVKKPAVKKPAVKEPAAMLHESAEALKAIGQELRALNERMATIEGKLDQPRRKFGRRRG